MCRRTACSRSSGSRLLHPNFSVGLIELATALETSPARHVPYNFRIAPDGRRVAVDRSRDDPTGGRSVWTYEGPGRPPTRITFGGIDEWAPVWSPDAESLTFLSYRDGPGDIHVKSLVTPAPEEPLIKDEEQKAPGDWSPDGRFLAYSIDRTDSRTDIWVLPVRAEGRADSNRANAIRRGFSQVLTRWPVHRVRIGRTGQMEIYVQPFPPTGGKWQVSVNGGMDPVWRGRELLLSDRDRMLIAVPVTTSGSTFSVGRAVPLFKISTRSLIATGFDISPDGRRVLVRMQTPVTPQPMTIVLNWIARLKQ